MILQALTQYYDALNARGEIEGIVILRQRLQNHLTTSAL